MCRAIPILIFDTAAVDAPMLCNITWMSSVSYVSAAASVEGFINVSNRDPEIQGFVTG